MAESWCDTCTGACCRKGVVAELSPEEADFMREGEGKIVGFLVHIIPKLNQLLITFDGNYPAFHDDIVAQMPANRRFWKGSDELRHIASVIRNTTVGKHPYIFVEDCAYLDTSIQPPACTVYEDPRRPEICEAFIAGSEPCLDIRERALREVTVKLSPRNE